MSVLSDKAIKAFMKSGDIRVKPFKPSQVGPGSVDLHLGDEFRVFSREGYTLHANEKTDYKKHSKLIRVKRGQSLLVQPGELVHGITKESLELSPRVCGWLEGRSSLARLGLAIHVTAGFVQPGAKGQQVLEISNLSKSPIALYPGTRVCQIVFEDMLMPSGGYRGRFYGQRTP
ncbi:MAG: dCTP deaminase [Candidatus Diapherotrites archaeon]|nr:dCTP deaminase [Candidatus Diapherotrites archaeon]